MIDFVIPEHEQRTLPRLLAYQTERNPDQPFIQFCDSPALSFSQMDNLTNRLANGLADLGLGKGDRLAIVLPNCEEFVPIWFAAAKLGAIEVPVNPDLKGKLLSYVLHDCQADILVCHSTRVENIAAALGGDSPFSKVVVVGDDAGTAQCQDLAAVEIDFQTLAASSAQSLPVDITNYTDPLSILYTSGTTGPAKGVIMPHHQYYLFAEMMAANMGLTAEDTYYTPLPLFHGDAQLFGVFFPLVYGTQGTIYERFSASRYWDQIKECGATATNMLGAMAHILWKQPEKPEDGDNSIRTCQVLPMVPFKEEFERRFNMSVVTAYGQTETNFVTIDTAKDWRPGSCGRAAPGFQVAVVDEFDQPLPPGKIGEIVVRPDKPWCMSSGYYGKLEKTVEAYRNLWFHSGDTGYLDKDGWLYFSGRIKDVIRRRGENISAQEVESVVDAHPQVIESAAVAVPSELSEDDVKVFASIRPDAELQPAELVAYCRDNMPKPMVPRYVEIVKELLPRTPSEKIAKEKLREQGNGPNTWDDEQQCLMESQCEH